MSNKEQKLHALDAFREWSNYLLVTTVAALGWVASTTSSGVVVWCFAASTVFGIFTLALIPIVAERITDTTTSIYDVEAPFRPLWMWGCEINTRLKWACWPQHIAFIVGIVVFAAKQK